MERLVFPTYVRDLDREILFRLPDSHLGSACRTDSYTLELCNGRVGVWRSKFSERYIDIGPRDDYMTLYRDMRQAEMRTWAYHQPILNIVLRSGSSDLLIWLLDDSEFVREEVSLIEIANYLLSKKDSNRFMRFVEWTERRTEKDGFNIRTLLGKTVSYGATELFFTLIKRYKIDVASKDYETLLLSSSDMTSVEILDYLWPYATPQLKDDVLDNAVSRHARSLVHYAIHHGVEVKYSTILTLLIEATGEMFDVNLLDELLDAAGLTEDEIYSLIWDYIAVKVDNQLDHTSSFLAMKYYLQRLFQPPIVALTKRLSDEFLRHKERKIARLIVDYDLDQLLNYLWYVRGIEIRISVYQIVNKDADNVFSLWLERLGQRATPESLREAVDRLALMATASDATDILKVILREQIDILSIFQYDLVKEALSNDATDSAIYLLTLSKYVDEDDYQPQYDLLDRVVEELEIESDIKEIVLDAMELYEETGSPYPERDKD